jgi:serine-type D-Ala-D-Ala carboxypeptidase (penicillin-binding protein 5/6)
MKNKNSASLSIYSFFLVWLQVVLFGILMLIPGENFYSTLQVTAHGKKDELEEVPISLYPQRNTDTVAPELSARAALVMDVDSAVILFEKNSQTRVYPASTTKIMTALVSMENYPLDRIVTIGEIDVPPQKIYLSQGEKISIENLLYATLVASGNDAAEALAQAFPTGRDMFVEEMNKRALELHLTDTHFTNPTGLDDENHFSSAIDLARLSTYAIKHPVFSRIVATIRTSVFSEDGTIEHKLSNINQLLGKLDGMKGVKTGYTQGAGETLIALTERKGNRILTVILGSEDRFGETEQLVEWAFGNHKWINPQTMAASNPQ